MQNYFVTKLLTKFGYYFCGALITLFTISGFFAKGAGGGILGIFLGALFCIPTMMFCEMCLALIKIEENTRNQAVDHKNSFNHAA